MPPPFSRHVLGMMLFSVTGPLGSDEDGRLVELVDQSHRNQQHAGPQADVLGGEEVDVGELDEDLLRVLDLDLRVEEEAVVEPVAGVEDRPQVVELVGLAGGVVLIQHLAVAGDRHPGVDLVGGGRGRRQTQRAGLIDGHLALGLAAAQPLELLGEDLHAALELLHVDRVVLPLLRPGSASCRLGLRAFRRRRSPPRRPPAPPAPARRLRAVLRVRPALRRGRARQGQTRDRHDEPGIAHAALTSHSSISARLRRAMPAP